VGVVVNTSTPLCIVSELFAGGSLHDYLHSDWEFKPSVAEALYIATGIARGMHYLHTRRPAFLHRDLKPRNCLLSNRSTMPHVVLADFGLCQLFGDECDKDSSDAEGGASVMGTASYMSPNVMNGDCPYTEADDVYSFGVCLWETMTGRVPFAGMRPIQVLFQVTEDGARYVANCVRRRRVLMLIPLFSPL
jgi:mitogen-activated protein kinase kinase kinase 7